MTLQYDIGEGSHVGEGSQKTEKVGLEKSDQVHCEALNSDQKCSTRYIVKP